MLRSRVQATLVAATRSRAPLLARPLATSVSSVPPAKESAPSQPVEHHHDRPDPANSAQTTGDALYSHTAPSAKEPFPYSQPLAATAPSPQASATAPTPSLEPSPASAHASRRPEPILEPEPLPEPPAAPVARVRKPVGAFRGGLIGFLLGLTCVGGYGYFRVLDDYHTASVTLLASVEELKSSTEQMASHLSRITALEEAHAKLAGSAASTKDVAALRTEYRKLLDSEHVDLLSLRAHVWGLEQDLKNLSRRDTSVRI